MDVEVSLGILAGCILALFLLYPRLKSHPRQIPTLHPHSSALGNLPDLASCGTFQQFLSKFHHTHGSIFAFWYGPLYAVSLSDPKYVKCVGHLLAHHPVQTEAIEIFLNKKCMASVSESEWKRRRRIYWDVAFGPKAVSIRLPHTEALITTTCLPYWNAIADTGEVMETREYFLKFTIKAIYAYALSETGCDYVADRIFDATKDLWILLEKKIHCTATEAELSRFEECCRSIKAFCGEIIARRRQERPTEKLFIDLLLQESDEEVVYADVTAALLGGIHATSMLLVWSLYYLARFPEQQEEIWREVAQGGAEIAVKSSTLSDFIDEVQRLSLLTTFVQRLNDGGPIKLPDGYEIPAGALVYINAETILWSSSFYRNPFEFNPARFRDSESRSLYQFFPFSFLGGRSCPGKWLALQEVTLCLSTLIQHFSIEFHDTQILPVETVASFFNHPKQEIRIRLRKRTKD